jgi:hypothetical protein
VFCEFGTQLADHLRTLVVGVSIFDLHCWVPVLFFLRVFDFHGVATGINMGRHAIREHVGSGFPPLNHIPHTTLVVYS